MISFLIRCIFWFSLVLLFLPINVSEQAPGVESVNPLQAIAAVRDTVRDLADICMRQPDVCATASAAVQTITARAKEGMRIARELVEEEHSASPEAAQPAVETPAEDDAAESQSQ
ncbi:DUF5330 domain-containing protein [Chelativorans sp. YIM 93263]|uniref:DUF5330 domain-containing protein n=1 Tax=Chelativorans sp. YIM 93263 TaxID=2906648 RepID=UPI002378047F|nr:DUF5330 domain-containing protein [Chelativorans sp. YIM 93263]